MESENTVQPQTPLQNSGQSQPAPSSDQPKQFNKIIIILGIIFALLAFGVGGYFLGTNKNLNSVINNQTQVNTTQTLTNAEDSFSGVNKTRNVDKAVYIKDGDIYIYDIKNNQTKKLTSYGYNTSPILSPDSSRLAYLSVPEAIVKAGKVQKFTGSGLFDQPISYEREYNVWAINVDGTNPIQVTKEAKKRTSISWSADSNKISFEENGQIIEYDLSNKKTTILGEGTIPIYPPKGDGRAFVFDKEKSLQVFNNNGGQAYTHQQSINDLNWSNKNKIFFTSVSKTNGPTYQWKFSVWVYPIDGKPHQITQEQDRIHTPSISPDESFLVASQGSGYADAGNIDLSLVILKLNSELTASKQMKLEEFKGPDFFEKEKSYMFPSSTPIWLNDKEVLVALDELLDPKPNPRGIYKLNVDNLTATRLLEL